MTVLVSVDTEHGELRRYECGGAEPRLTHQVQGEVPMPSISPRVIAEFRDNPDLEDYVGPPFVPTPPTPPTGAPAQMTIAA